MECDDVVDIEGRWGEEMGVERKDRFLVEVEMSWVLKGR